MTGIVIGKILTAHGVRGLVKFRSYMDDIDDLPDYNPVTCADGRIINITIKNSAGGEYIAEITGISDRTIAESFRNQEIFIAREKLPETDSDEFYIDDLIGLSVLDTNQTKIGTIQNIVNFGASDLFEIKHENGKLFYCPMAEPYLVALDIETSLVVIQDFEEFMI
jgi:16S rRNA processing protein RimM